MSLAHSRVARPIGEGGGRSIGWWGAAFGVFTVAHLVVGVLVAAVYLRAFTEVWPPVALDPPGILLSAVAVGLTVVAAVLATVADRRTRAARGLGAVLLTVAAVLSFVAAGLRGSETIFSGWPVTDHAYWSIRWALGALDVLLLATLGLLAGLGAFHTSRGIVRPGAHSELAIISLWSWATAAFVVASWTVFGATTGWGG